MLIDLDMHGIVPVRRVVLKSDGQEASSA